MVYITHIEETIVQQQKLNLLPRNKADDPWQIKTVKLYLNYNQLELATPAQSEVTILWFVPAAAQAIMWLETLLTPVFIGR